MEEGWERPAFGVDVRVRRAPEALARESQWFCVPLDVESIDLLELSVWLERQPALPAGLGGYLEGKTRLREAVRDKLGCSELEAEQVTDTLVARGFVTFRGSDSALSLPGGAPGFWEITPHS